MLLLFGAIIAYGLLLAYAPALVILCWLWLLGSHPFIAIMLAAIWLLKTPIRWFFEGLFIAEGVKFSGFAKQFCRPPKAGD